MSRIIPEKHRCAPYEDAFIQALSQTWNNVAPRRKVLERDALNSLLFSGHIREFGGLTDEQLQAWEKLVTGNHRDLTIARKLARSIL